jgi:teichuronic acid biosynthesis glycosyltransferase TuaG
MNLSRSGRDGFAPPVSIITPVYNAARWLPATHESVRAQTLSDWEHIFVDDGSTDESASIIRSAAAADPRIRLLNTPCQGGPAAARNLALENARGRYVAFLDADDLWLPEKLECCLDWMRAHDSSFVYHDYRHMSADGLRLGAVITGAEELNLRTLHTRRGHGCLSMVFDRERVGDLRFPTGSRAKHEDFLAWLRIIEQGHTGHRVPRDLGRYRLYDASRNANKLHAVYDTWLVYRNESKLPLPRAISWWTLYVWNTFRMYRDARPQ